MRNKIQKMLKKKNKKLLKKKSVEKIRKRKKSHRFSLVEFVWPAARHRRSPSRRRPTRISPRGIQPGHAHCLSPRNLATGSASLLYRKRELCPVRHGCDGEKRCGERE
jgi:hypothetical protein